jgi:iron(III) transport system ATP-binding protein
VHVRLDNITKRFGDVAAVRSVSLEIRDGELFFLLGPSGCGKTTVMRMIAGFYEPDEGRILFNDRDVSRVAPHQRNTGMVFQNYALWPHMTVFENVAYGLDVRRVSADDKKKRVIEALEIVQMTHLAERSPNQLSGGQQQRVALARALVIKPDVLLLDEPLSNLDAKLRLEMRDELKRIHEATRITALYVTHDQKEALSLADRMAVMKDGVIEQLGTPQEVYRSPANQFVAGFIGEMNFLQGKIESIDRGADGAACVVFVGQGRLRARCEAPSFVVGQPVTCGIRPEAVWVGDTAHAAQETVAARVVSTVYLGETEQYILRVGDGQTMKALEANPEKIRRPGDEVAVGARPQDVMIFPSS